MAGKVLWQECEAAGHMTSIVRKQRGMLVLSSVSPFEKYFILFTYLSLCTCVLLMNLCARYSMYVELRGHLIGISSLYGLQELITRQPGLVGNTYPKKHLTSPLYPFYSVQNPRP